MKRNLALVILACLMLCCTAFAACNTGVHTHTIEKVDAKAATCEIAGNIEYYRCTDCDKLFSDEFATTEIAPESVVIAALGHDIEHHDAKAATCTEDGWDAYDTCSRCDYTTKVVIPAAHTPAKAVNEKEVAATCAKAGSYDLVVYCSVCKEELSRETKTIDKLLHTEVIDEAKAPTCTETGLTEGKHCSVCNEVIVAQQTVAAIGHKNKVHHEKVDASCTEAGTKEYWACPDCNKNFSDKACATEVTDLVITALGHAEVNHAKVEATCTTDGNEAYVTCSRCDYSTYKKINALGHDAVPHDAKAATCDSVGWGAYETCSRCDHTTKVEIPAIDHKNKIHHKKVDASCTEAGTKEYWACPDCNKNFSDEDCATVVTDLEIEALGHDNKGTIAHKDATCTEAGVEGGTYCTRCNDGKSAAEATISALGHVNKQRVDAKNATFAVDGNVAHWHCSDCGVNFSDEDCTTAITDVTIKAMGEQYLFEYVDGIRVQAESTLYSGASIQNAASGKILGSLSTSTIIKFGIQSDVEREVELFVNSVIRVDSSYSSKASDRFTLTVNGASVDLSSTTITGVKHVSGTAPWYNQKYSGTSLGKITLSAGENVIEITTSSEMNIDYFYFTYPEFDYTEWLKVEAEDTLFSGLVVRNDGSGKILGINDSASLWELKFVVYSDVEKEVELFVNSVVRVNSTHSSKASDRFTLKVDGNAIDLSSVTLTGKDSGWYNEPYRSTSLGKITLKKGPNFVEFSVSNQKEVNIDYFYFDYPPFEYADGLKVEAENTLFSGLVIRDGGSGKILGYSSDSEMKFVVHSDAEREVELFIGALICTSGDYSKVAGERFTLTVNDVSIDLSKIELAGVSHGGGVNWWDQNYNLNSFGKISLVKGANVIKIISSSEMNIDCFYFNYPVFTYDEEGLTVQAENTVYGNVSVQSKNDRTNLGSLTKSSTVKFAVYSDSLREVEFFVNSQIRVDGSYSATGSDRFTLKINGIAVDLSEIVLTGVSHDNGGWYTKDYSDASLGKITLAAGVNAIEMTFSNEMNVDYFVIK